MGVRDPRDNHRVFERCWNAHDIDGLIALYDENAAYMAGPGRILRGHDEIRSMLRASTSLGENRLELVSLSVNGEIALERTRWTLIGTGAAGERTESSGSSTVVLRRGADGSWRMIIDDPGLG